MLRRVILLFFDNHLIRYLVYFYGNDGIIDRGQLLFLLCSIYIRVLSPCKGGSFSIVSRIVIGLFSFDATVTVTAMVNLKKEVLVHSN